MSEKTLTVRWIGEDGYHWQAVMGIKDSAPCIIELGYERSGFYSVLPTIFPTAVRILTYISRQTAPIFTFSMR